MKRRSFLTGSLALAGSTLLPVRAGLPAAIPTEMTASALWAQKTPEEITADLRAMIAKIHGQESSYNQQY